MSQEAYAHIQGGTDTEHFAALLMSILCSESDTQEEAAPQEGQGDIPTAWESYHTVEQMQTALERTIATINTIQANVLGKEAEPNDLNIAMTDGKSFVACRYRNHPTEQPPSLYYSTTAGVTLNRKFPDHPDGAKGPHGSAKDQKPGTKKGRNPHAHRNSDDHGKHAIVASEPSTYRTQDWVLIEKNHMVLVGPTNDVRVSKMESGSGAGPRGIEVSS